MIDAARHVVHRHDGVTPDGYAHIDELGATTRLAPRHAPEGFAFALDELEAL